MFFGCSRAFKELKGDYIVDHLTACRIVSVQNVYYLDLRGFAVAEGTFYMAGMAHLGAKLVIC